MKRTNMLWSMLTLLVVTMFTFSFASCSSDDDGDGSKTNALIGTWGDEDGDQVIFRDNTHGTLIVVDNEEDYAFAPVARAMKAKAKTSKNPLLRNMPAMKAQKVSGDFTYTYNAETGKLVLKAAGETLNLQVQTLTNSKLVIVDEDGDVTTFTKISNDTDDNTGGDTDTDTGIDVNLIFGDYGACGNKLYGITQDGKFRWYINNSSYDESSYRYDTDSHIISITENNGNTYYQAAKVLAVGKNYIKLYIYDEDGDTTIILSRITAGETNTVGDIKQLYGKELLLIGGDGTSYLQLDKNGKYVWNMMGSEFSGSYKWSAADKTITLSVYSEQKTFNVTRLNDTQIFLYRNFTDSEGETETTYMEYRAI